MSENDYAVLSFWVGVGFLALFVILNFGVERIWFPRPRAGAAPLPPLVGPARRAHMTMGTIKSIIFIVGIVFIGMGISVLGTQGYGSF